jgi:hypothetical protein
MEQLTKEQENLPVTHGELLEIITTLTETISKNDAVHHDAIYDLFRLYTDKLVESIEVAEYNRKRDMHYMLSRLAAEGFGSKDALYQDYLKWCEKYDIMHKPKEKEE